MASPFEVLGLLPTFVANLSEEQIKNVAKEMGKALNFVFHPDKMGGDAFRSREINVAVGTLSSDSDMRDARDAYLFNGPGQREIRAADAELVELQYRFSGIVDNIRKMGQEDLDKAYERETIDKDHLRNWITALYSDRWGMFVSVGDEKDGDELTAIHAPGLFLRHAHDLKLRLIAPYDIRYMEERLKELEENSELGRDFERESISRQKSYVADTRETIRQKELLNAGKADELRKEGVPEGDILDLTEDKDLEKYKKDVREKEEEIRVVLEGRRKRQAEIDELRAEIRRVKSQQNITGSIDSAGYLITKGKNTGLRVAGYSDHDGGFFAHPSDFGPCLVKGEYMVGIGKDMKPVTIGVLQDFGHRDLDKKVQKGILLARAGKEEKKKKEEKPPETTLAVREDMQITYKKNPFEAVGLLPSIVRDIPPQDLRIFINAISKSFMKVLHPDAGGSPQKFAELSAALDLLENPELFEKARMEYVGSSPGAGKIAAIGEIAERMRKDILDKIPKLAKAKADAAQEERRSRAEKEARAKFFRMLLDDLFTDAPGPAEHPESRYLRRCGGISLSVATESGTMRYALKSEGFDVFAVAGSTRIRLIGSTTPGKFRSLGQVEGAFKSLELEDVYLHTRPAIHPKSYLVGVQEDKPRIFGLIESINEGRRLARKMAKKIEKKAQPKPLPRKGRIS